MIPGIVAQQAVAPPGDDVPDPVLETEDSFWTSVVLQLSFAGANGTTSFTDQSLTATSIFTQGDAQIQNNKLELDGSGDVVRTFLNRVFPWVPHSAFTAEAFGVEFDNDASDQFVMGFDNQQSVNFARCWKLFYYGSTNELALELTPNRENAGPTYQAKFSFTPATDGTEYDIAWSWDGATARLYVDGELKASVAVTGPFLHPVTDQYFRVGSERYFGTDDYFMDGRIAAVRLTRACRMTGDVYARNALPLATAFDTASATDPLRPKRVLLLFGEGADENQVFVDHGGMDLPLEISGAVKNDTDVNVNGSPAINFGESNSNWLRVDTDFQGLFTTTGQDFCFEADVKLTAGAGTNRTIMMRRQTSIVDFWFFINTSNKLSIGLYASGAQRLLLASTTSIDVGTAYHVAAIRDGGVTYLAVNGVIEASGTQSGNESSFQSQMLSIGYEATNSARYLRGSLNNLRVTIGDPVYNIAGFTPDPAPYPIN